jgi:hypothetical protein
MILIQRTPEAQRAYVQGFNAGLELAARRMESANDETSRQCLIEAVRKMTQTVENPQ